MSKVMWVGGLLECEGTLKCMFSRTDRHRDADTSPKLATRDECLLSSRAQLALLPIRPVGVVVCKTIDLSYGACVAR